MSGLSAIMTVQGLINLLKNLPPEAEVFVFDPQDGSRYEINAMGAVDHWDDDKVDINLLAITLEDETNA